ncbi:hypothetical protein M1D97_13230 [Kushneria sp. AK178]
MVTERARRQYLEAMGVDLWVARHPLPNALASSLPAVEEAADSSEDARDHHQRLHALIDEVDRPEADALPAAEPSPSVSGAAPQETTASARSIRALLDIDQAKEAAPPAPEPVAASPAPTAEEVPSGAVQEIEADAAQALDAPLRFSLQVGALDGRWLVMLARDEAPSEQETRLLEAIFRAGGVAPSAPLSCQRFGWPMMEGLPVDDALDEARQGFKAFLAGRRARGWRPERLLLFGRHSVLEQVLDARDGQSHVLELPLWQGPALESLDDASSRRTLWAAMGTWRTWWHAPADTPNDDDY